MPEFPPLPPATRRLFWVDPADATTATYDQLWEAVLATQQPPATICTSSLWDLAVNLLACIALDRDVCVLNQLAPVEPVARVEPVEVEPKIVGAGKFVENGEREPYQGVDQLVELIATSRTRIGIQTSGSTGEPRIVWHQLRSLTRAVRRSSRLRHAVWGLAFHPCHFAGLQVFFQALLNENCIVPLFGLPFDQSHLAVERFSVTHISGTPTYFNLFCGSDAPIHPGVHRMTTGGERLSGPIIERIRTTFPNGKLNNIYASTEAGSLLAGSGEFFTIPPDQKDRVKIVDGELAIHRSLLAESLLAESLAETADEQASGGRWQGDFWLTGDMVEFAPANLAAEIDSGTGHERLFRICGRNTDVINVGGYNVNPLEVEGLLLEFPEICEARVFGQPNSVTGHIVACDVVLRAEAVLTAKELRDRLSRTLPAYKIPRIVNRVGELAQTNSGKRSRR
jgi:acyl-coenzyme A synthetase/AMP-(fatty) acid ligase